MHKILRYIFVYLAWIFMLLVVVDLFVAGAFGFEILKAMTKTVVWYRIIIALLGAIGIWYIIYERFILSKGKA